MAVDQFAPVLWPSLEGEQGSTRRLLQWHVHRVEGAAMNWSVYWVSRRPAPSIRAAEANLLSGLADLAALTWTTLDDLGTFASWGLKMNGPGLLGDLHGRPGWAGLLYWGDVLRQPVAAPTMTWSCSG